MTPRAVLTFIALQIAVGQQQSASAAEPAYFRFGSGVAKTDKQPLPAEFSASNRLWMTKLLPGHSTPCVCGDAIYLTTFDAKSKQLVTVALDRKSGKTKWTRPCPAKRIESTHQNGSPATCTPACDGQRVYSFFGSYGLLCYDLKGKLKWKKPMGPFQDEFGCASSPVLVDGKVVLNQDHDVDNFLIAFDAKTGKQLWKTPRDGFTRSYSTPVVWEANGRKQIVVAGALQLTAYDPSNGKPVWWVRGLSRIVDVTPVVAGGMLYIASWTPGGDPGQRIAMEPFSEALKTYDKNKDGQIGKDELKPGAVLSRFYRIDLNQNGKLDKREWDAHAKVFELAQNVAIAVKPGGQGDVTETHVKWTHRRGLPTVPSPLVYRGVMYMVKDGGILTALDAATGKQLKQARLPGNGNYYASLVGGDGNVYATSERGVMTVVKAGKSFEMIGSHNFRERIMATPVIDRGRFYVRTEKGLYCFAAK
jgi:outer membrane protein assembly factor BamB